MYNKQRFYEIVCKYNNSEEYENMILGKWDKSIESYYEDYSSEDSVDNIMNYGFNTPVNLEEIVNKSKININDELVKEIIIATFIMHNYERYENELPTSIYNF